MTPPQTAPARMDDETFQWVDSPMSDFSPDGFAGQYDLLRAEARRARDSEAAKDKEIDALRTLAKDMAALLESIDSDRLHVLHAQRARDYVQRWETLNVRPLDRCPTGEDAACQDCTLRPECGVPQGSTKQVEMEKGKKR